MDFKLGEKEEKLKIEVREFAKTELPADWPGLEAQYDDHYWPLTKTISPRLAARGWLTMAWPRGYRSREATAMEQLVYAEEAAYYGIPGIDMGIGGVSWIGPSIIRFGTEEQKKQHLPGINRGETYWCTGYSEPGSGSDLASLQCRAVNDGDDFVINGQKVWTSAAHIADWCWLLARTDATVPPHKGLSLFLVPTKARGVTISPLQSPDGIHHFNEMFFDNVRVPRESLVGEKNRGWYQVMVALDMERASPGVRSSGEARGLFDEIIEFIKHNDLNIYSPLKKLIIQNKSAEMAVSLQVGRLLAYRVGWMADAGKVANYEASMCKLYNSELLQRVCNFGLQALGCYGSLLGSSKYAQIYGRITLNYVASLGITIAAGTSEVQRSIIAQRGLGLPR